MDGWDGFMVMRTSLFSIISTTHRRYPSQRALYGLNSDSGTVLSRRNLLVSSSTWTFYFHSDGTACWHWFQYPCGSSWEGLFASAWHLCCFSCGRPAFSVPQDLLGFTGSLPASCLPQELGSFPPPALFTCCLPLSLQT